MTDKHHGVALLADASEAPLLDIEEVRGLVTEGKERGYLTFAEISATFEEVELTKEQVTDFHAHLQEIAALVILTAAS